MYITRKFHFWGPLLFGGITQVAQIYLPSRDANLQDVVWNQIGVLLGGWVGMMALKHTGAASAQMRFHLLPGLLVGAWLMYRLLPMVPSLDLQAIKDSLKPLFLTPEFSAVNTAVSATGWLLVAALLQRLQRGRSLDTYLPLLILMVFVLEVLIVDNTVSVSNVVGATVALAMWRGGFCHISMQAGLLSALLLITIAVDGVTPLVWRLVPTQFEWLPFHGLLGGSMYVNVQAICQKIFLYGSLVYFLWQTRIGRTLGIALGIVVLASVESMQMYLVGHTPEITDPLLLVMAAFTILAMREDPASSLREDGQPPVLSAARSTPSSTPPMLATEFVGKVVNLRIVQADFLKSVSERMGVSVTDLTRQILDQFVDQYAASMAEMEWELCNKTIATDSEPLTHQHRWVECKLILNEAHANFVGALSTKVGLSESRILRRLVSRFMSEL